MRNLTIFLLLIFPVFAYSQKHDYVWITGDDNQTLDTTYGGSLIDFNFNPVKATYNYRELNMFTTNSSICDSVGNLLFYTNGCAIAGADDELLENGDNINPGGSHTLWCENYDDGYAGGIQSSVILPLPDSENVYLLFHKRFVLYSNPYNVISDKLYSTIVDMKKNNGSGSVVEKNVIVISDSLALGEMTAVKHANGKDWWLVTLRRISNTFYIFKVTKDGIVDTFQHSLGIIPNFDGEATGQIVFSPDGSKLYRTWRNKPIMVYSFDREAGVFTQFDTIHYEYGNQLVGEIGCAVSPNGRFLYLGCRKFLYQLDLWATDISASQTTVAEWDGFTTPIPTLFYQLQLGPDCKIYGLAGGDTRYFHVIHNPDEPGLACNVEQRGLVLPTRSGASMPSFPNYRLGPLDSPGVPCTATVSAAPPPAPQHEIRVYPNPATDNATFDWATTGASTKRLLLRNALGQPLKDIALSGGGEAHTLSVRDVPPGIYFWALLAADGRQVGAGKIVKE